MTSQKSPLQELAQKATAAGSSVSDLFSVMRLQYLSTHETARQHKKAEAVGAEYPQPPRSRPVLEKIADKEHLNWGDTAFHLKYRARNFEDLAAAGVDFASPGYSKEALEKVTAEGYDLSVLPLNLVLPDSVKRKFIPELDYFEKTSTGGPDPYGIFTKGSKLVNEHGEYLASRKTTRVDAGEGQWKTALMNVTDVCPIGCAGCYKSAIGTREDSPEIELEIGKHRVIRQTGELVTYLNSHPDVYDTIVSGGEPLMYDNATIKEMLTGFERADSLRILRICTGAIFQGLPTRIDEELLGNLKEFSDKTGKQVTFNAHLSNHYQLTPEALMAVDRIKQHGFDIYSQVPIQEGVNFFKDDPQKTKEYWIEMGKRQTIAGVQPYKFIVDMHPRTQKRYVPIEPLIGAWSEVYDSHTHPELQRPKTLSVLMEDGNIVLGGHTLFAMKKEVGKDFVTYQVPLICRDGKVAKTFTYREPLQPYNSDPKSLDNLRTGFFGK